MYTKPEPQRLTQAVVFTYVQHLLSQQTFHISEKKKFLFMFAS